MARRVSVAKRALLAISKVLQEARARGEIKTKEDIESFFADLTQGLEEARESAEESFEAAETPEPQAAE